MDSSSWLHLFIILLLILTNGLFAMSEIAIVSARKPRLQQRANKGDKRAAQALKLANDPADFLSTVQIGITLIGIMAGVFGGATLARDLAAFLQWLGLPEGVSGALGLALVVSTITYLTLVVGELVPKNLALQNAERVATAVAPFMYRLSRIVYPLVRLLSVSTQGIMRLLGVKETTAPSVSDEEIAIMMQHGAQAGVFEPLEPEIVKRIFRLSDQRVRSLMTPRRKIIWLDPQDTLEQIEQKLGRHSYSRFPVANGDLDHVIGYVESKDLLQLFLTNGSNFDLRSILRPPLYAPGSMPALELLERFKQNHAHMVMVLDEYGGLKGLVTSTDLLEAIVGDIDASQLSLVAQREDGSWLIDGLMPITDMLELLGLTDLPYVGQEQYQTVGGLMMSALRGIPTEGQYFESVGFRFEVVDMDGFRVDKVLVSPA